MTRSTQMHIQDWCPHCQIGQRTPRPITLVAQVQGQLLQLPDVQLYHCDICGNEEVSDEIDELLEFLTSMDVASGDVMPLNDVAQLSRRTSFRRKDASVK